MTNKQSLPFIGVRIHRNRTASGRRSSTPARRAARYMAYGRDLAAETKGKQRGLWYGPEGKVHDHQEILAWARQEAFGHRYTFEAVLSMQQAKLAAADFCRAMEQGESIQDWRLMLHRDTAHRHAHVLFFRDKRLEKAQFLAWQQKVREALLQSEKQQAAEQHIQHEMGAAKARGLEVELV